MKCVYRWRINPIPFLFPRIVRTESFNRTMTTSDGIVQWFHEKKDQQSKEMSIRWVKYRDIEMEIIETAY